MYFKKMGVVSIAAILTAMLSACGGGDSSKSSASVPNLPTQPEIPEEPNNPTEPTQPTTPISNQLQAMCSTSVYNCGSLNDSTYTGNGTGIWSYVNDTENSISVGYNISNVNNKNVTKDLVSLNNNKLDIQNVTFDKSIANATSNNYNIANEEKNNNDEEKIKKSREVLYQKDLLAQKSLVLNTTGSLKNRSIAYSVSNYLNIGDSQLFYKMETENNTDIEKSFTVMETGNLSDGRKLYIWVETDELQPGKIVASDVTSIKNHFLNIYDSLIFLNGETYLDFANKYNSLISDSNKQPINIMLTNMDYNKTGFGLLGYYASINEYLKKDYKTSNEALQVFLDTETIYMNKGNYLDINNPQDNLIRNNYLDIIKGTLSHEFTHLILYTQRVLLRNSLYTTFSNEAFAEAAENILDSKSQLNYDFFLNHRVSFYTNNLGAQCKFNDWSCYYAYEKTSVLMAFLVRKYGVQFYIDATRDNVSKTDYDLLDNAIKKNGGKSFADELINFQVLRAGLSGNAVPGFDLPEISSLGFTLKSYNNIFPISRSASNPLYLNGMGGSWFKTTKESNPQGTITLPPKTAFVLVVQ